MVRALAEHGDHVRVVYRHPERLKALRGLENSGATADVLDYRAMRRVLRAMDVLHHEDALAAVARTGLVPSPSGRRGLADRSHA